jgi:AraC-like DNA-binding protein
MHLPRCTSVPAPIEGRAPVPPDPQSLTLSVHRDRRPLAVPSVPGARHCVGLVAGRAYATLDGTPGRGLAPDAALVVADGRPLSLRPAPHDGRPPVLVLLTAGREPLYRFLSQVTPPLVATAPGRSGPSVRVAAPPPLRRTLRALVDAAGDESPLRPARLALWLAQLLLDLLHTPAAPLLLTHEVPPSAPDGLAAALGYARRHLHRPLSVDELAEQACMSRASFYRHFRRAVGTTPLQYLNRMRMTRARALLRDPARTVTDVSLALGFRSVSHFIDTFKGETGTTPKAYQRRTAPIADAS